MKPRHWIAVLSVFAAVLLAAMVSASAQSDYIVGGTDATIEQYPFMVQLETETGSHECSGTLLRADRVLTAAHCIRWQGGSEKANLSQWMVRYGTSGQTGGTAVGFSTYSVIPGSNVDRRLDLAVLHLDTPATLGPTVQLVEIATDAEIASATGGLVLGWGKTSDAAPPAALLQQTQINWLTDAQCTALYGAAFYPDRHFCGGDATTDICHGDSGGPTMITDANGNLKQVAITSAVYQNANCATGNASLFTDLRPFRTRLVTPHQPGATPTPTPTPGPAKCAGRVVTVFLGQGDMPTADDDVILGTPGNDIVDALGGNDVICTGLGADMITAGDGDDIVHAGGGDDTIIAGPGADSVFAGTGNDVVDGGIDDDKIWGGAGNDELAGGDGADRILGWAGDDVLTGGLGNDTMYGMAGVDELDGGDGDDYLGGGPLGDILRGGPGFDRIHGKLGPDMLYGGEGDDWLFGGGGDDWLFGEVGDDLLRGGAANDTLSGAEGTDRCLGMAGIDSADGTCDVILGVP